MNKLDNSEEEIRKVLDFMNLIIIKDHNFDIIDNDVLYIFEKLPRFFTEKKRVILLTPIIKQLKI